ncbi:MAG: cytochrome c3 family protein [Desulfobacterales bacterium]|nr:cytochrome c3 family protein [Desulfobacterales bacterium]
MRTKFIIVLMSALVFAFILGSAYSQEEMTVVDRKIFDDPERPSAAFAHDAHNEAAELEECGECHHVYDEEGERGEEGRLPLVEDEDSSDQQCAECHEFEASGPKPGLMKAFHLNCKGCHVKNKKGPITCGECHVR